LRLTEKLTRQACLQSSLLDQNRPRYAMRRRFAPGEAWSGAAGVGRPTPRPPQTPLLAGRPDRIWTPTSPSILRPHQWASNRRPSDTVGWM